MMPTYIVAVLSGAAGAIFGYFPASCVKFGEQDDNTIREVMEMKEK